MKTIFVDSNIFMYAAGKPHAHKEPSVQFLLRVADGAIKAVTSCEVLQEIMYRYWHIKEHAIGLQLVEHITALIPAVLPTTRADILRAKEIMTQAPALSPRDAFHAAVMLNHALSAICTFDKHFDTIPGIKRIIIGDVVKK